jgi:hypothetical protein
MEEIMHFAQIELRVSISSDQMTVARLVTVVLIALFWMVSGWLEVSNLLYSFVDGFYWCMTTIVTVGYGDITPTSTNETIYVVFICILGPCLCATIIANVVSFLKNDDMTTSNVSHRKLVVETFLSTHGSSHRSASSQEDDSFHRMAGNASKSIYQRFSDPFSEANKSSLDFYHRARSFFDVLGEGQFSVHESNILEGKSALPRKILSEIKSHLIGDIVQTSGVFSKFDSLTISRLINLMHQKLFVKQSVIINPGWLAKEILFVRSGVVQICTPAGKKTQRLMQGDYFGSAALLPGDQLNTFFASAVTTCEVWSLTRSDFMSVCQDEDGIKDKLLFLKDLVSDNHHRITDPLAPAVKTLRHINKLREPDKVFILPNSLLYCFWCAMVINFTAYNGIMIPLRIAFGEHLGFNLLFICDYIGDLIFAVDILLLSTYVAFYDHDELVLVTHRIRHNYCDSLNFMLHLIAVVPLELFALLGSSSIFSYTQWLSLLRINRLLRLCDISTRMVSFERAVAQFSAFKKIAEQNVWRLFKLACLVLYCCHVVGCIFFTIADQVGTSCQFFFRIRC